MLEYLKGIKLIADIYEKIRSFFKKDKKTELSDKISEPIEKDNITIYAPQNTGTVTGKQTIGTQNNHFTRKD